MGTQLNASILDSFQVLQEIMGSTSPLGSRELSRRLNMEHTRANRLLKTLTLTGMVCQTVDRKYAPGASVHILAAQSLHASGLLRNSLPFIRELKDDLTTVALGVLWKMQVAYLLHARPWQSVDETLGSHELVPVEISSLGIALLAVQDDVDWSAVPESIHREVRESRKNGYATLRFPNGAVSIAVAVGDPVLGALGISRKSMSESECRDFAAKALDIGARITERISSE